MSDPVSMQQLEDAARAASFVIGAHDDLHLRAAAEAIKDTWPTATAWTREYVGYDDMPGGDWYLTGALDNAGNLINIQHEDWEDAVERINNILGDLYEMGDHCQVNQHRLP